MQICKYTRCPEKISFNEIDSLFTGISCPVLNEKNFTVFWVIKNIFDILPKLNPNQIMTFYFEFTTCTFLSSLVLGSEAISMIVKSAITVGVKMLWVSVTRHFRI